MQIGIRDTALLWYKRQERLFTAISNSTEIFESAYRLFIANRPGRPVRSLSVRATSLSPAEDSPQLSFLPDDRKRLKLDDLERAKDRIREKYGYTSIRRGILLTDPVLDLGARGENIIHPPGFLMTCK